MSTEPDENAGITEDDSVTILIGKTRIPVILDREDYPLSSKYVWTTQRASNTIYVRMPRATVFNGANIPRTYLHRLVMGFPSGHIDHINGNGLDNRKCNLRVASSSENGRNSKIRTTNLSGYRGVSWDSRHGKWESSITLNYKKYHLGFHCEKEDAATCYNIAAIELHGDFARLNL